MTTEIPTDVNINSNIGSVATITATTFVAVAGVTVVLRLYTKLVYVKKVTYSDAVIIAAWVSDHTYNYKSLNPTYEHSCSCFPWGSPFSSILVSNATMLRIVLTNACRRTLWNGTPYGLV